MQGLQETPSDLQRLAQALPGRSYRLTQPYEVAREKLREFASAIGEMDPVFHDPAVAVKCGFRDVVAVPTFPIVITFKVLQQLLADPELVIDLRRVVHGDQKFTALRPLCAGDVLGCSTSVTQVRTFGGSLMVATNSELHPIEDPKTSIVHAEASLLIGAQARI
ncbi:MAG: hypothetical protein DLM55_02470 [Acidimicrobiales bacterium]|nr:MAG: hypothetical protein DLM55_02470 [Acidimicrobiales bacterium]